MIIKSIAEAYNEIQWYTITTNPSWFICRHAPYIAKAMVQSLYRPLHKNTMYNTAVWDGLTSNDFKRGRLIAFLHRLGAVKQMEWVEDDGRGYFIGYKGEDV